jgi:ribonuclease P protein component
MPNPAGRNKTPYSFPKAERICRKADLQQLFSRPRKHFSHPLVVLTFLRPSLVGESPLQMVAVAPKKKFRKAVARNQIKRRVKEVFRLQKEMLKAHIPENATLLMSISIVTPKIPNHHETMQGFHRLLNKSVLPYLAEHSSFEAHDAHSS